MRPVAHEVMRFVQWCGIHFLLEKIKKPKTLLLVLAVFVLLSVCLTFKGMDDSDLLSIKLHFMTRLCYNDSSLPGGQNENNDKYYIFPILVVWNIVLLVVWNFCRGRNSSYYRGTLKLGGRFIQWSDRCSRSQKIMISTLTPTHLDVVIVEYLRH